MQKSNKKKKEKTEEQILISMPDGEGGMYKTKDVKKFLKQKKSKLKPEELARGKDFNLLYEFHEKNF